MNKPVVKKPRLQIDILAAAVNDPTSSTARLNIPLPPEDQSVSIQFKMKVIQADIKQTDVPDHDEQNLMQGSIRPRAPVVFPPTTLQRLRGLFHTLNSHSRKIIIQRVRAELQRRLLDHIRQAQRMQSIILGDVFGDMPEHEEMQQCQEVPDEIANLIMDAINVDTPQQQETDLDPVALTRQLLQLLETTSSRDLSSTSTASSSSTRTQGAPEATATTPEIATYLRNIITQRLLGGHAEDYLQAQREVIKKLLLHVRRSTLHIRLLLMVISEFLPQPDSPQITGRQVRMGNDIFKELLQSIAGITDPLPENHFQYRPLVWMRPWSTSKDFLQWPSKRLTFLESAGDVVEVDSTPSTPEALRGWRSTGQSDDLQEPDMPAPTGGQDVDTSNKDTQTTALPDSQAAHLATLDEVDTQHASTDRENLGQAMLPTDDPHGVLQIPLEDAQEVCETPGLSHGQVREEHQAGTGECAAEDDTEDTEGVPQGGRRGNRVVSRKSTKRSARASSEGGQGSKAHKRDKGSDGSGGLHRFMVPK